MKDNRTVRIAFTNKIATFTQRGLDSRKGFVRIKGATITGEMWDFGSERVFYSDGLNHNVPYEGDSGSW